MTLSRTDEIRQVASEWEFDKRIHAPRAARLLKELLRRVDELEQMVEAARRSLSSVAESMTEHAYQELASALESTPRIAGKTAGFDQPGRELMSGER